MLLYRRCTLLLYKKCLNEKSALLIRQVNNRLCLGMFCGACSRWLWFIYYFSPSLKPTVCFYCYFTYGSVYINTIPAVTSGWQGIYERSHRSTPLPFDLSEKKESFVSSLMFDGIMRVVVRWCWSSVLYCRLCYAYFCSFGAEVLEVWLIWWCATNRVARSEQFSHFFQS